MKKRGIAVGIEWLTRLWLRFTGARNNNCVYVTSWRLGSSSKLREPRNIICLLLLLKISGCDATRTSTLEENSDCDCDTSACITLPHSSPKVRRTLSLSRERWCRINNQTCRYIMRAHTSSHFVNGTTTVIFTYARSLFYARLQIAEA